ncbi:MAG: MAC/perforin domain-containing protein, partial [Bacteroidota bacterium]|nr:MAC/perforin domain-containing protein [Bacteroidota bacterium]
MKKMFLAILIAFFAVNLSAQEQSPGLDVLGYGYDVFGNYADQQSKKRYCLFKYSNFRIELIGTKQYKVPQYVFLENMSSHKISTVQGSSMRQYSKDQSASVGLGVDAKFFSGSVNTSFSKSSSGTEQNFYYTYRDANTKWRVSFDERDYDNLDQILDPRFKQDLATMDPAKLFELYGTHYIASAYLGGRADFHSVSVITSETNTSDIAIAVDAQYKVVTANVELSQQKSETLSNANTKTTLIVTGGNSEYANNISDPVSYDKWASGIAGMPVLCDFDKNSLKPIWDFCETEARKRELKAEFAKMLKANPLPPAMAASMMVANQVFFIGSVADKTLYFDVPGYHFDAYRAKGTPVNMYVKNNYENGLQGIDRFIKIIPHLTESDYVFLQPQHSDFVIDVQGGSKNAGAKLHLWKKGNNNANQMFKLIEVDGKKDTYYIQNKNSGL